MLPTRVQLAVTDACISFIHLSFKKIFLRGVTCSTDAGLQASRDQQPAFCDTKPPVKQAVLTHSIHNAEGKTNRGEGGACAGFWIIME